MSMILYILSSIGILQVFQTVLTAVLVIGVVLWFFKRS